MHVPAPPPTRTWVHIIIPDFPGGLSHRGSWVTFMSETDSHAHYSMSFLLQAQAPSVSEDTWETLPPLLPVLTLMDSEGKESGTRVGRVS